MLALFHTGGYLDVVVCHLFYTIEVLDDEWEVYSQLLLVSSIHEDEDHHNDSTHVLVLHSDFVHDVLVVQIYNLYRLDGNFEVCNLDQTVLEDDTPEDENRYHAKQAAVDSFHLFYDLQAVDNFEDDSCEHEEVHLRIDLSILDMTGLNYLVCTEELHELIFSHAPHIHVEVYYMGLDNEAIPILAHTLYLVFHV